MTLTTRPKRRPTTHHKKRQGAHHKQSKHYAKPYWPYLPMLLIVVVGFAINTLWTSQAAILGYASNMSSQSLLESTNTKRAIENKPTYTLNANLNQAAQAKAEDMAARDYWSHNTPDGKAPWSFVQNAGYQYEKAGENLAYGFVDADQILTAWMQSREHRANVLNDDYQEVGFGLVNAPDFEGRGEQTIVVAMYAKPAAAGAPASLQANVPYTDQNTYQLSSSDAQPVARVQLLTSASMPWAVGALSILAGVAAIAVVVRHGYFWRKALTSSEAFIIHHPFFDLIAVSMTVVGMILSRAVGFIS